MPTVTCKRCGKMFDVIPSLIAKGKGKFCSRACVAAARTLERPEACARCGGPMPRGRAQQRYCTPACARAASADRQGMVKCIECGRPCRRAYAGPSYCSLSCRAAAEGVSGPECPYARGIRVFDACGMTDIPATIAQAMPVM